MQVLWTSKTLKGLPNASSTNIPKAWSPQIVTGGKWGSPCLSPHTRESSCCVSSPLLSAQSQAELYPGTSPLLLSQFRCSFLEAKWGSEGGRPPPATFLISSLQIRATICLKLPDGSECWAWKGWGRHGGQLKHCGPAPVPWLKLVLMDAEMRHLSREALEPSRGQQEGQNTSSPE